MNYLQLCNDALSKINEVEMTSGNFASSRGIQTVVKNAINDAINIVHNHGIRWPFVYTSGSQTLTVGENEYALPTNNGVDWYSFFLRPVELLTNTDFGTDLTGWTDVSSGTGAATATGGKARLTGDGTDPGAIEQSISTIEGQYYDLVFRVNNNDVAYRVGTTSGGIEVTSGTAEIGNAGASPFVKISFTAESATTYIGFYNTSTTYSEIDQLTCREIIKPRHLKLIPYDTFRQKLRSSDELYNPDAFETPCEVYQTANSKFGVTPYPDKPYEVIFDYWAVPTELSAFDDEPLIPARYHMYLVRYAVYVALALRQDPAMSDRAIKELKEGLQIMRRDLVNKEDRMRYA